MNFWNIRSSRKFRYGRKSQVKEDVNGGGADRQGGGESGDSRS